MTKSSVNILRLVGLNPNSQNHYTFNYYHVGPKTISSYAKTILLTTVLSSDAFAYLRT